jgi:hypothetical protein
VKPEEGTVEVQAEDKADDEAQPVGEEKKKSGDGEQSEYEDEDDG